MDINTVLHLAQVLLLVVCLLVVIYLHERHRSTDQLKELRIDFVYLFFGFLFGANLGLCGIAVATRAWDPFYGPGFSVGVTVTACMALVVWSIGTMTAEKIAAYKKELEDRRRIQERLKAREVQDDTERTSSGDLLAALVEEGGE